MVTSQIVSNERVALRAAQAPITAIIANDIHNNEGFILVDGAGASKVFKFDKDGGGTSGGDVDVAITAGETAAQVAALIQSAVDGESEFSAIVSSAVVTVTQITVGSAGNQTNSDTVADTDFTVENFTGGTDTATAPITAIIANDISNDEGFTLVDGAGASKVFKFDKDGGGVTGADVTIVISTGDSADTVASAINTAVDGRAEWISTVVSAVVTVVQVTPGPDGNRTNADTVTDVDFTVDNFTGGADLLVGYEVSVLDYNVFALYTNYTKGAEDGFFLRAYGLAVKSGDEHPLGSYDNASGELTQQLRRLKYTSNGNKVPVVYDARGVNYVRVYQRRKGTTVATGTFNLRYVKTAK